NCDQCGRYPGDHSGCHGPGQPGDSICIRIPILGGFVVLASSIAGSRYRRIRETAILKTVGATRGMLLRMLCAEFAVIGSAAGIIGGALAAVASAVLIGQLLDTPYKFSWLPVFFAAASTAMLTVLTGWVASYGIVDRKPLDILRQ